jgi:predicted acylesterase/phospholipase RssA
MPTARRRKASKIALVCAGGGVTGAVYEIGCLRALDEILGPKLRELDLYVGISGGAFVASLLAAGVSPREMYDEAILPSRGTLGAASADVFRWSGPELLRRIGQAPRVLTGALRTSLSADGWTKACRRCSARCFRSPISRVRRCWNSSATNSSRRSMTSTSAVSAA